MTTEILFREKYDKSALKGALYYTKKIFTTAYNSNAFLLPIAQIYAIAVKTTGAPQIFATIDTISMIEADTADWELWDGTSLFNLGITSLKIVNASATGTVAISVKGAL